MELIINIFIVERKDNILFGTVGFLIILNMKYWDFCCRISDFGWRNTKPMGLGLTELPQCSTPIMAKIMSLQVTMKNISTNFSIWMQYVTYL